MSNVHTDGSSLIQAVEYVQNIHIHRAPCKAILDLVVNNHMKFNRQDEWPRLVKEICESFKLWSELDELERLMQCDNIFGTLALMRTRMAQFGIDCQEEPTLSNSARVYNDLLPAILSLLATPDGIDRMECLPPNSLHKAMALLQRVLDTISPASPRYLDVHTALMRLQRADTTANLEAPDLTPHISDISDEPFAKGGFSDVYTGEWLRQGRVALKILRILGGSGASRKHRLFRKEVKIWHSLRHPHLLQFWGLCNTAQGLAMISAFMPNGCAPAYLATHPDASALSLLVGAAYGLEYLHTRQPSITHGDLRGANILVSPNGEACLADFGLSKIMEVASGDSSHGTTTANAGATRWMAPELFHAEPPEYPPSCPSPVPGGLLMQPDGNRGSNESRSPLEERDRFEGVTPRSDVWAYGMTILELMTGKVPFPRIKNSATVMLAILRGERPSKPVATRNDWTPELYDLMQECWHTRPSFRPTMSQVSEKMRSLRDASRAEAPIPQSLLIAINTPLQPVSPTAWGPSEEEQADLREASFIYESPTTEISLGSQLLDHRHQDSQFCLAAPPKRRKSTAEESSLSRAEADDALPPLPILSPNSTLNRTLDARPRSSSAPMTVPTQFVVKEHSPQPTHTVYQSQNSSLVSIVSASNQSRFSKASRPTTPATPVPEESPSSPPDSPVITRRKRISSFWRRNSLERVPLEVTTSEGAVDSLKTVMPILQGLIAREEAMLGDNFDATFSSRLRQAGHEVVPLERIDQLLTQILGGYVKLRKQHRIFLQELKSAEDMTAEDIVPTLRSLLSSTIESFGSVYPKYAFEVHQVEEVLSGEMESNFPFRVWLQESDDVKLRKFLQKPLTSIETIFVSLSQWIAFAKLKSSSDTSTALRGLEQQLVALLMRVRLGRWQGAMGRDEFVYNWRQLVSLGDTQAFADEERQSAIFELIRTQGMSVLMMQGFYGGVLKRIVLSPTLVLPKLNRLYTDLASLIEVNSQLLNQLHAHQMQSHPRLTDVTKLFFDSISNWGEVYSLYSTALVEALGELELHSAEIFPVVHAIPHPILKEHDLSSLAWLPINHIRRLSKSFFNLLDATSDKHEDLKVTVEVISTLNKLIDLCDSRTVSVGIGIELRQFTTQLQWRGDEDHTLELDRPERRVVHTGRLLMPQRDSDSFLDLFVVLLDNCLIITNPRSRWGLATLQVLHTMLLENMSILDLDAAEDLYLLDASHGETIAAPLPIRYETSTAQNSLTLLCFTTLEAIEWRRHITTAKVGREGSMEAFSKNIFERGDLVTTVSFTPSCSAEFQFGDTKYFVVGGQDNTGLWIREANQRALRQLLAGVSIRQCSVVPSLDLLLVLSGKSLISFKLEDLVSSKVSSRQVDAKGPVVFFRIGTYKKSLILVVAVASSQASSFTVRIYEAGGLSTNKGRRSSFFGIREQWSSLFKQIAEIPISHQLFDCAILDQALFLIGADGFLFLDNDASWSTSEVTAYPVFKGLASSQTYHRCKTSKPINVHDHGDLFLLCYADFGIYVNRQGLVQGQCLDWTSERVTQIFFSNPYVLLVSKEMLEARLIQTGRVIDRVESENVRVTLESTQPAKRQTDRIFHFATVDRQNLRGFEVPSMEPCSIYQWKILASK